jgi:hypothetical protein
MAEQAPEPAAPTPVPVPYPVPSGNPYEVPPVESSPPPAGSAEAPSAESRRSSVRAEDAPLPQYVRFLKVTNETKDPLVVYVQYETLDKDGRWIWVPGVGEKDKWLGPYTVAAGQSSYLKYDGVVVCASRVRLMVRGPDGRAWTVAGGEDIWLVEENTQGERVYEADEVETYTCRLRAPEKR